MSQSAPVRIASDSFLDTLNSEIITGTESLVAWIQHLEQKGGIGSLFEMECWIKGLRCFFDTRYLPMSPSERSALLSRNFAPEIRLVQSVLRRCEQLASGVIALGQPTRIEFEKFIEAQLRRDSTLDYHLNTILKQPTPLDSLVRLLDSLNDFRVLLDAMNAPAQHHYQVYLSLGRCFQHELNNCRYVDMLLSQKLRLQYDRVNRPVLSALLRNIPDDRLRRNISLAFLYLFRLLKYLALIAGDLAKDKPIRTALVLFALVQKETGELAEFLKSRLTRAKTVEQGICQAAELVVYSLKVESQRIRDRELVSVARAADASVLYAQVENSHGLLRNCFQSGITALARAFDASFDPRAFFPSMVRSFEDSQRLRQDLWGLRQFMKAALEEDSGVALDILIERLSTFREASMRHLMYRDWVEFEGFSDELVTAPGSLEVRVIIRKLVSFIETLIQEVSKRSALQSTDQASGQ